MKKPISILFDSYHLYHLPQFEPLIDLLSNDKRFDIYHSTSREIQHDEYELCKSILTKKPGEFIFAVSEAERKEKIRKLNLDAFVCGWSRYDIEQYVSEKTLVCMAYHGIGIKPSYWRDNHDRLDLRFVEGPYRMSQLKDKGIKTDLALTGFMKLDSLFKDIKNDKDPSVQKYGIANQGTLTVLKNTFSEELYMCIKKLLENELNYKEAHYAIKPESLLFTFSLDENSYPYVSNIKFKSIKASDKSTTTKFHNHKKTIFTQEDRDWEIRLYDRKFYRGGSKPAEQPRRLNLGDIFSFKKNDNDPKTSFYYELRQETLTQIKSLINTELNKNETIPFILKSHDSIEKFLKSLNAYMLDKKEKEAKYAKTDTTNSQSFLNRCFKGSQSDKTKSAVNDRNTKVPLKESPDPSSQSSKKLARNNSRKLIDFSTLDNK